MKVLNKKCLKGETGVYIGRPSIFGNPFVIGRDGTRADVVRKYEDWIRANPELMERAKRELKGHNVICWCSPAACHGDVLVKICSE